MISPRRTTSLLPLAFVLASIVADTRAQPLVAYHTADKATHQQGGKSEHEF